MAPKASKPSASLESLQEDLEAITEEWIYENTAIYIDENTVQEVVDIEGRQADLCSVSGYNCSGKKIILQAWGAYSFPFGDYMKVNHKSGGQVYVIPDHNRFKVGDVCFRSRTVTPFQRKHYSADFCYVYSVAENTKMNYKDPPKMLSDSLPVPMGDWDTSVNYEYEYTNDVEEKVKEQVSDPSDWHLKGKSRSCGISASFLASPVKKRSFAELSAMSSAVNSPIKTEPGLSSSSSASSVPRSPLFPGKK